MQYQHQTAREKITTGDGPMDLDTGAFSLRDAVKLFTGGAAGLAAGSIALLFSVLFGRGAVAFDGLLSNVCSILAAGAGLICSLLYLGVFATVGGQLAVWHGHYCRQRAWHAGQLAAYRAAGGAQVDRSGSVTMLTTSRPTDVLQVALVLAERARRGELAAPSVEALTGVLFLNQVRVGELTKRQAEEFAQALHQVGVIKGRKTGYAGQLATTDEAEIIKLVTSRAGRIRQIVTDPRDEITEGQIAAR